MFIGTQLRKVRIRCRLSQQEIANELGVSQSTYWNWENDKTCFNIKYLEKLAKILAVDASDLLPRGMVIKLVRNLDDSDYSNEMEYNKKVLKSLEKIVHLLETDFSQK